MSFENPIAKFIDQIPHSYSEIVRTRLALEASQRGGFDKVPIHAIEKIVEDCEEIKNFN